MVLRDIYPNDAGQSPLERLRSYSPPQRITFNAHAATTEKRMTRKAKWLMWGGVLAAASLFPGQALAVQQDSSRATATSTATKQAGQSETHGPNEASRGAATRGAAPRSAAQSGAAQVTAPPAKLPVVTVEVDAKRDHDEADSATDAPPQGGIYLSIGDSQPSETEAASNSPSPNSPSPNSPSANSPSANSLTVPAERRSLVGIPAEYIQRQDDAGLVQQAPLNDQPTTPRKDVTSITEADIENASTAGPEMSRTGPIVAPVASIQGFSFQSRVDPLPKSIEPTARMTEKSFVDPTQYRVRNAVADKETPGDAMAHGFSGTTVLNEITPSPRQRLSASDHAVTASGTPFTDDLNSVVKHVVSSMPTDRLPPVDMIPSSNPSASPSVAIQTAAQVNAASVGGSIINKVEFSDFSERRGYQDQDKQQRAPGEPELYSISQIKNPLANLDYPTNDSDYGDQVPVDESVKRFGDYTAGKLVQDEIRTSISYGKPSAWFLMVETWESPAFAYRPLYFEEVNLERYGHYVPRVQPVLSAAHFAASLASLPYQMYVHPPCEPIYTLGHYRPGSCNPHQIHYLPLGR